MLSSLASTESHYNRIFSKYKITDQDLLPFVFSEISVLARRDGISITERQIEALWIGRTPPQKIEEHVIANFARAFYNIEKLVEGNFFTRVLMQEIHSLLVQNIGEIELPTRNFFDKKLADPHIFNNPTYVSDTLDALVDAGRRTSNMKDIIIFASELSQCLWDIAYVPSLRNLTEYLVRRAFFLLNDLPLLSYVPFASKLSLFGLEQLEIHENDYGMYSEEGLNCSFIYTACIQAYLDGIVDLKDTLDAVERELDTKIARINSIPLLNDRQKNFAIYALRNSKQDYKIQDYIDTYDVAYATARHDMLMLVDLGLFSMRKEGKAFVFCYADR